MVDAEGGSDSWARPTLSPINEKNDSISTLLLRVAYTTYLHPLSPVFQQIDVEESVDQSTGAVTLRMYGVTEVRHIFKSCIKN